MKTLAFSLSGSLRRALLVLFVAATPAWAAKLVITVTHDLEIARPSETITVPWAEVARAIPGALLQKIAVRDAAGDLVPYQVTNIAPLVKDPKNLGVAYGDLIFQYSFPAGMKAATFTVEATGVVTKPFSTLVFARAVPERLDDFAWENDRLAHRIYGPALGSPAPAGSGREVLVSSGLDIWCKRVRYPVVDRWYNKGHDHYHIDEGEGMDLYQVGASRGCGGTGVWDGKQLFVGRNYATARVIANGPIRAIFELTYEPWAAGDIYVTEVKRFTVDAGHNLDRIESTFSATGNRKELLIGIGLNRAPSDPGQDPKISSERVESAGSLTQWIEQKSNGNLGTALMVPAAFGGFAQDDRNELLLAKVKPGETITYYAGAGWDRAGDFKTAAEWKAYVAAMAARVRSPVQVTTAAK
jgi:hypothetical protein